jgi:hypothetical protein
MKKLKNLILIIAGLFLFLSNCTYNNEVDFFKDSTNLCKTDSMSFQNDVYPVLLNSCVGCHGNFGASAGVNLEGYDNVKKNNIRMMNAIEYKAGASRMPQGASKLPACTINQLNAWIAQGLKNN